MICTPCCENRHEACDDVVRREGYVKWLRATYAPKKGRRGQKDNPGVVVGPAELAVIRANEPYDSCPCQHRGSAVVETARAGESFEG